MEADQLQKIIQKCLSGDGTDQERAALKAALVTAEYEQLREELCRLGELEPEELRVDEEKMWKRVGMYRTKGRNRLSPGRRILRYAAIITIPLAVGWVFLEITRQKTELPVAAVTVLEPGYVHALLKLDGGGVIDLERMGRDTVVIRSGVGIRLDSAGNMAYLPKESGLRPGGKNSVIVPRGGEYCLTLSDGSVVWLNSESELSYPVDFSDAQRRVALKGEAFFEVADDSQRPFVVEVAQMEVKVLGTQFNINASRTDSMVQTTLLRGKVEVSAPKGRQRVVLQPDQQAILQKGVLSVKEVDAAVYAAWKDGMFYFEEERLSEIAAQLERWFDIHFFFNREGLKGRTFTGVIRRDFTAGQILDIIAKTTDVQFEIKERTVVVK